MSRVTAQRLSENLGQPVVVDSRPGASGVVGGNAVAKAPPDGYTLLMSVPSLFTIVPHLVEQMPFRTEDLAPVTLLVSNALLLVTHPSVPVKSVGDLIALARSKPGTLSVASAGSGTVLHLAAEQFQAEAGVRLTHVPYGAAQALVDLSAGRVQLMFHNFEAVWPYVKGGRLRAIAVTSRDRVSLAHDIPTLRETGLPAYEVTNWYGVFAHAATPRKIADLLNRELTRAIPEIRAKFPDTGGTWGGSTAEELAAAIRRESAQWGALIRKLGLKSQ
ncbi:MAG: tripartite tricarboxylate transporter substrate binding protein [Betaproteobacteria bacterium]|nr:tripartite tricarboxylate transporter substrate binding protein [Betaproteobacteria bacterium]